MADTRNQQNKNPQALNSPEGGGVTKDIKYVDTVVNLGIGDSIENDDLDAANEIYGVKRGASVDIAPGGVAVNGAPPVKRANVGRKKKDAVAMAPPPIIADDGDVIMGGPSMPGVAPVVTGIQTKRKRAKVRRLPVKTNSINIWDTLSKMNAGLSILDWLL